MQNTPASDSSVTVSVGTSSSQVLSPRKEIETAILSHLRQITPTGVSEKRVRVRRTLAECLTSDEVSKRSKEDERRKKGKAVAPPAKANLSTKSQKKPASHRLQLSSQRCRRPVLIKSDQAQLTVRKPTWMTNGGLQQKSGQSASSTAEPVTAEPHHVASAVMTATAVSG